MKNALAYKGFTARIDFDADDNILVGRVLGIRDIIGFHGETVSKLTADFHNAIDHYLADCKKEDCCPAKPYSGKLTLRVPPGIHGEIASAAAHAGKSLNKWVADTLTKVVHSH